MADKSAPSPTPKDARDARLKAALKANMAKRKAQAKARQNTGTPDPEATEQDDG
ncbi:hypothetical protein [uncultured Tateyamaria sp.]|uniref:hypothetical protein n=1 Tax=uncultured Tateyamaria sp. TaxID=455651 RepID=UPI00260556BD|nr:hypothetical protein [uncultured Tateyamaria sp.]